MRTLRIDASNFKRQRMVERKNAQRPKKRAAHEKKRTYPEYSYPSSELNQLIQQAPPQYTKVTEEDSA